MNNKLLARRPILAAVESENPPLRLALGKYATDKTEKTLNSRLRDNENWKHVGLATEVSWYSFRPPRSIDGTFLPQFPVFPAGSHIRAFRFSANRLRNVERTSILLYSTAPTHNYGEEKIGSSSSYF